MEGRQLQKRSKTEQACSSCRALRRKCNGRSPCERCLKHELVCIYDVDAGALQKLTLSRAIRRITELEQRLLVYRGADPRDTGRALDDLEDRFPPDQADSEVSKFVEGVSQINLIDDGTGFYGGSSTQSILYSVENKARSPLLNARLVARTTSNWCSEDLLHLEYAETYEDVPAKVLADQYVNEYFQCTHALCPILPEDKIRERYEYLWNGMPTEGSGYDYFLPVLLMVIASGHQLTRLDRNTMPQSGSSALDHGAKCFEAARRMLSNVAYEGGDISAVHAIFLGAKILYNMHDFHHCYMMLGTAMRVGYAIGLHRHLDSKSTSLASIGNPASTWWLLSTFDTDLAALTGRPCSFQPREVDVSRFAANSACSSEQYIEYMRQFSNILWIAYEKVYCLSMRNKNAGERAAELFLADQDMLNWFRTFENSAAIGIEQYGKLLCVRQLLSRMLLYRAFLVLLARNCKEGKTCSDVTLKAASQCVALAQDAVQKCSELLSDDSSCLLRAAKFQNSICLWNAVTTLMLYWSDPAVMNALEACGCLPAEAASQLVVAMRTFARLRHLPWINRLAAKFQNIMGTNLNEMQWLEIPSVTTTASAPNLGQIATTGATIADDLFTDEFDSLDWTAAHFPDPAFDEFLWSSSAFPTVGLESTANDRLDTNQ